MAWLDDWFDEILGPPRLRIDLKNIPKLPVGNQLSRGVSVDSIKQ